MLAHAKNIFTAIHQNKWLAIEYHNREDKTTKYWIAIEGINPKKKTLRVLGLHLNRLSIKELDISIDRICSSSIIDGSYHKTETALIDDIQNNNHEYLPLFGSVANLKTLNYLEDCNRLDAPPCCKEFALIKQIDANRFCEGRLVLDDVQFGQIVGAFSKKAALSRTTGAQDSKGADAQQSGSNTVTQQGGSSTGALQGSRIAGGKRDASGPLQSDGVLSFQQIALNVLSFDMKKGLYVLAYKPLFLDVATKELVAASTVLCSEFIVEADGVRKVKRIRQYLDNDSMYLLDDFDANAETIKDRLSSHREALRVDDRPYLVAIGFDNIIDLGLEYSGLTGLYEQGDAPIPVKAFFGELTKKPAKRKKYDIVLMDKKIDLDQILAIHKAIKYPLAYIQGPPGTGKTTTIKNTILNAFFNGRTVLFASNNNHPVDGVYDDLCSISYQGRRIPFPVIRLGDMERQNCALDSIRALREEVRGLSTYGKGVTRKKNAETRKARQLTDLLARYEERLELLERQECIEKLLETSKNLKFVTELRVKQLKDITERLTEIGEVKLEDALELLSKDSDELAELLLYLSVQSLRRLDEPKYKELLGIINDTGGKSGSPAGSPAQRRIKRAKDFNAYLSNQENLKNFLKVFPIVITTCISARRLGEPRPSFDMVIIDEASQCNTATALVPVIRGSNLMLVGDPQQLNPVVNLDPSLNNRLRKNYGVSETYDYCNNSIYKVFLACDSVSDEILLSHHYRCDRKIIEFNNQKYYNGKLKIMTKQDKPGSLVYYSVSPAISDVRNTAPAEAQEVIRYVKKHPGEKVGIITPFTNQRDLIVQELKDSGLSGVPCGTVHAFQGDETDTILFSTALTKTTSPRTYAWLATNRELINVATSRARKKLVVLSNRECLEGLHESMRETDDIYELVEYIKSRGGSVVTKQNASTRALGIKPYSTETESAFLESLNHALDNIFLSNVRYVVYREVPLSQVFIKDNAGRHLFYTGRLDFVVYERVSRNREIPVLAIELDGKEHYDDEEVRRRDIEKNRICAQHGFSLIRVDNTYARRYNYIKNILGSFFKE